MDVEIVIEGGEAQPACPPDGPEGRFSRLPEPVPLEDTIATHDPLPRTDVELGRDPERDFMLRYAG